VPSLTVERASAASSLSRCLVVSLRVFPCLQILVTTGWQGRRGISDGKNQTATTQVAAALLSHSRTNPVRLIYGRGEWT